MTMPSNLSELARKGDPKAIATLMNRKLEPKGITAKAAARHGCLQIQLESEQVPNQAALVSFVQKGLDSLGAEGLNAVRIYGYQAGVSVPAWEEEINLSPATEEMLSSTEADFSAETSFDDSLNLAPEEDSQPTQNQGGRSRYLLAIVPVVLVGVVGLVIVIRHLFFEPKAIAPVGPIAASSSTAPPTTVPANPASPAKVTTNTTTATANANSFRQAVNQATQAAVATQSATNTQQWQQVISLWQGSIALLKQVPPGNANHQIAQQKIGEYQRNLAYAQQRAKTAAP